MAGDPENSKFFDLLAVGVANGGKIREIAEHVGCSVAYAYEISRTRQFRNRVSEVRSEAISQAVSELAAAANAAAITLHEMLSDVGRPDGWTDIAKIRLAAAKAILSNLTPLANHFHLRGQVEALERDNAKILEAEADL